MNIDQLKQDLCKQMAIIDLIERSQQRAMHAACGNETYYKVFGYSTEQQQDVAKQNQVTQRLVNYLTKLTCK